MTDLQQFLILLQKADAGHDIRTHDFHTRGAKTLVEVLPGYRAHFEAEFDDADNIVSIGQWDEM